MYVCMNVAITLTAIYSKINVGNDEMKRNYVGLLCPHFDDKPSET